MKLVAPIAFILSLMWFFGESHAASSNLSNLSNQSNVESNCQHFEDVYLDSAPKLSALNLNSLPQYAELDEYYSTGGVKTFVFSPRYREWAAYDQDGYRVAKGVANGGQDSCPDLGGAPCHTPSGVYHVYSKGSADCVSRTFPVGVGGAQMPYCMFFHNGYAIHGSPYISTRNGSHGCIRVHTSAAQWLSRYFISPGTKVVVLPY